MNTSTIMHVMWCNATTVTFNDCGGLKLLKPEVGWNKSMSSDGLAISRCLYFRFSLTHRVVPGHGLCSTFYNRIYGSVQACRAAPYIGYCGLSYGLIVCTYSSVQRNWLRSAADADVEFSCSLSSQTDVSFSTERRTVARGRKTSLSNHVGL